MGSDQPPGQNAGHMQRGVTMHMQEHPARRDIEARRLRDPDVGHGRLIEQHADLAKDGTGLVGQRDPLPAIEHLDRALPENEHLARGLALAQHELAGLIRLDRQRGQALEKPRVHHHRPPIDRLGLL
jgi:hypothetical protein